MSTKCWKTAGIILISATALSGSKTVPSIVSASHLVRKGNEVKEIRVTLMRDHKLYVEEITEESASNPACTMSLAVLPEPAFQRIEQVMVSQEFRANVNRQHADEMKAGERDIWHIAFRDGPTRYFIFKPPQSPAPRDFVAWFDEAQRLKPIEDIPLNGNSYQCTIFSEEMSEAWRR
jgi:hypothetical protein